MQRESLKVGDAVWLCGFNCSGCDRKVASSNPPASLAPLHMYKWLYKWLLFYKMLHAIFHRIQTCAWLLDLDSAWERYLWEILWGDRECTATRWQPCSAAVCHPIECLHFHKSVPGDPPSSLRHSRHSSTLPRQDKKCAPLRKKAQLIKTDAPCAPKARKFNTGTFAAVCDQWHFITPSEGSV